MHVIQTEVYTGYTFVHGMHLFVMNLNLNLATTKDGKRGTKSSCKLIRQLEDIFDQHML